MRKLRFRKSIKKKKTCPKLQYANGRARTQAQDLWLQKSNFFQQGSILPF